MLVGLLGSVFDAVSLTVTYYFVKRAAAARSAAGLVGVLSADLSVASVSCAWAYMTISYTLRTYYEQILPIVREYSFGAPHHFVARTLWGTLEVNPAMWFVVIGLGLSAALPTVLYLIVLLPALALRLLPKQAQHGLGKVVWALTTDAMPVFKQLGTALAAVAGAGTYVARVM